jgi:hypothetical protein
MYYIVTPIKAVALAPGDIVTQPADIEFHVHGVRGAQNSLLTLTGAQADEVVEDDGLPF